MIWCRIKDRGCTCSCNLSEAEAIDNALKSLGGGVNYDHQVTPHD